MSIGISKYFYFSIDILLSLLYSTRMDSKQKQVLKFWIKAYKATYPDDGSDEWRDECVTMLADLFIKRQDIVPGEVTSKKVIEYIYKQIRISRK